MSVTLAKGAGFCQGVRLVDKRVKALICDDTDGKVFTIGKLIHNRLYLESLDKLDIKSIEFDDVTDTVKKYPNTNLTFVIRAHGIEQKKFEFLNNLAESNEYISICDMTCPYVKRIQNIARDETSSDTAFLLYCNPNHPEAIGILSYAKGTVYTFSTFDEFKMLNFEGKIPILCSQTTQNLLEFAKIKKNLKKVCTNAKIFDTICSVTENRQKETALLAKKSDKVIVIGGYDSSNTRKLFEVASDVCPDTVWIESVSDLSPDFKNDGTINIGITAGASTPDGIITEVYKAMENNEFSSLLENSLKTLHTGDTVTGTVVTVSENEVALDLGTKVTGVLVKEQVTDDPTVKLVDMFKSGDTVDVFVIHVDDHKGIATVSKKRVDKDNSWVVLKEAYDNGDILTGKVTAAVKGGVVVLADANTVFVPASQTGIAKGGDLSKLVGTEQRIKLIEFDEKRKKAIGSIKVILNAEKAAAEEAIWATLEVGKHYTGTVKNLASYGAFVDIGGVDGMVHNTELSWKRIKHPSQVVSVGQEIIVFIKELDKENKRISLGYKTQEMDSWFKFTQQYHVGDVVPAKIVSIMPFGAFAEVFEDVDGLIHISRISTQRINSPADVLSVGQVVDVKITEIDDENRKLALSIRALQEEAEKAAAAEARAAELAAKKAEEEAEAQRIAEERADMAPYIVGSID